MATSEQIDKVSKKYVKITASQKRDAKKKHNRYLRTIRKDIEKPHPQHNRYTGFIG